MKNNLKLSHSNTGYQHDYQDKIYKDYPGKNERKTNYSIMLFFVLLIETKCSSICAGCNCQIYDQYLLKVTPDLEWHVQCLKCSECGQFLDENTTCFVVEGKTFCKYDYIRYVSNSICFFFLIYRPTKDFYLKKLSQMIIISAVKEKINTLQIIYVSSRQTTSFDKSER